jgi:hypothetical protein
MVDRLPLKAGESRAIYNQSLIQGYDWIAFYLLPEEAVEKKKRHLKERRKQINNLLQPLGPEKTSKGFGRRLCLDEMLGLWRST